MDLIYRYDPHQPITVDSPADAHAALATLAAGNARFSDFVRRMQQETMGEASGGQIVVPMSPMSMGLPLWPGISPSQAPFALVLGCSDARVPIEQVFDQAFNSLFVVRIAGNVLGTECLGSIDYAVRNLGRSLKLVVVLGHTGCGAVTAAANMYASLNDYADIVCTHALRSLVDRLFIGVRGASRAINKVHGLAVTGGGEGSAEALVETAVYLNAALTAYDLQREIRGLETSHVRVVYGVYDLDSMRVSSLPGDSEAEMLAAPPQRPEDFIRLGERIARRALAKSS